MVGSGLAVVYFAVFYYFFRQKHLKEELQLNTDIGPVSSTEATSSEDSGLPPQIASYKKGLGG